ncbi:MAG: VanZ family protein [Candidatus Omnitrophica bacterium]|nr:VanZ family protein [Candidatus Omnitrophota bacterium]
MPKRIILITFLVLIFIFQILPLSSSSRVKNLDKVVHFSIYFILTFLFVWNGFPFWKSLILSIGYGILMEIVQIPVPVRDVSFYDFLANCLGAFSFCGIWWFKSQKNG